MGKGSFYSCPISIGKLHGSRSTVVHKKYFPEGCTELYRWSPCDWISNSSIQLFTAIINVKLYLLLDLWSRSSDYWNFATIFILFNGHSLSAANWTSCFTCHSWKGTELLTLYCLFWICTFDFIKSFKAPTALFF
jgi:hypothetical protein